MLGSAHPWQNPPKINNIRDLTAAATPSAPSIQHPLAGKKMTGAEMIVQVLADEGVSTIFGYSGGAILPTYDAVFCFNEERKARGESQMPLIVPANEQGAGFMAAGYARASGRVGVAIVTSGPGATNTVTPIRDCMADSIPIVVICGQVPTGAIGTDAFQEAPVPSIMGSVAKHIFLVTDPDKLEATVRTAFEIARTGRPGPVVIDIPKDVQNWSGEFKGTGTLPMPGYRKRLETLTTDIIDGTEANHFFEMLGESQRPLIYAGGGVINGNARRSCASSRQTFDIPVVTTLMGIGAVDTTGPLSMRMLGMHGAAFANYAVDDCDFLIAIGARFDDRVAGVPAKFAPGAKAIAHFDIDRAEINKVKRVQWSHVGLLPEALSMLTLHGKRAGFKRDRSKWLAYLAEFKQKYAMNYDRDSALIQPYYVIEEINRITKGEAIISTGVGQHQMWAAQYFDFRNPRLWLTSGSMGTMGFGLPAAIGAQFAQPGQTRHRHRRRRLGPHEHRRDGNRDHLQPAGEDRRAEQQRRRHGEAVAEAVLQGPPVGVREDAAHQGLHQGRAGRRLQVRRAARQEGRCAERDRGIPRVQGRRLPGSHHRSGCRRVSDGRPGPALRGHDHR